MTLVILTSHMRACQKDIRAHATALSKKYEILFSGSLPLQLLPSIRIDFRKPARTGHPAVSAYRSQIVAARAGRLRCGESSINDLRNDALHQS